MSIGFKIKKLREEVNLSQENLAAQLGITQSELSKIENGRAKKIDVFFMAKVCDFFKKDFDHFTGKKSVNKEVVSYTIQTSLAIIIKELKKIIDENQKKDEIIKFLKSKK